MAGQGVALIVVHGVADQTSGETARALADLLVASEGGHADRAASAPRVEYAGISSQALVLTVEPLAPRQTRGDRLDATPRAQDRSVVKAWRQSRRSDFHAETPRHAPRGVADRGIALTDYLLAKHRDNGAGPEAFETRCTRLERREAGSCAPPVQVDLYEMYWADLSRLSGALPRIVTEVFTMVFRLSKLGRDTVEEAHRAPHRHEHPLAWRIVTKTQVALDWLFANVLALLFAQLFLLAQIIVALGVASLVETRPFVHLGLAGAAALVGTLVFAYEQRGSLAKPGGWALPALVAFLSFLAFLALLEPVLRPWISGLLLVTAVTLVYDVVLGVGAERFPFVRVAGRAMWGLLLVLMLASVLHEVGRFGAWLDPESFDVGYHAALFGVELTLLAIKWWWVATSVLLLVWLVSGAIAACEKRFETRASLATGRLGLAMSLASFLTLTMAIWALLTTVIEASTRHVMYSPCIFAFDEPTTRKWLDLREPLHLAAPAYAPTPNVCLWETAASQWNARPVSTPPTDTSGTVFLTDRYIESTTAFSLLAVVLLALVAYLVSMFTPSVLAELKLLAVRAGQKAHDRLVRDRRRAGIDAVAEDDDAGDRLLRIRRLGRWLTAGYRRLDAAVWVVALGGVVAGICVAALYIYQAVAVAPLLGMAGTEDEIKRLSQTLLKPLVLTTAGLVTLLSLLGGLLSKYLPELRAPLDVALDVDNHFREFPRTGIPRARIFSRYAALLRHVAAQGYERIVIVSHSQGTVITADLLRFLSSADGLAPTGWQRPELEGNGLPPIRLLTLGCPLRQLYAARFPTLYRWVIDRRGTVVGPRAFDIGVTRWINAFCSGDYVGRWLWSDSPDDRDPVGHPLIDSVDPKTFGRAFAYDGFDPMPPAARPFASAAEVEVCLGFGAHTHYLESDQIQVAWLVDGLIAGA